MKLTDDMSNAILNLSTVGEAVRLLRAYAHEEASIKPHITTVTYGINKKFHYQRYENRMFTEKPKSGYIVIDNEEYTYEEVWDEIDERIATAQEILLTHLQSEEIAEGR